MPPGEASEFPPPFFPSRADARALRRPLHAALARPRRSRTASLVAGRRRRSASSCSTRWRATPSRSCASAGRDRALRASSSAALVIPAQVAMLPLFLMLRAARPRQHVRRRDRCRRIGRDLRDLPGPAVRAGDPGRPARRGAPRRRRRVPDLLDDRPAAAAPDPRDARRSSRSSRRGTTSCGRSSS